MWLFFDTPVKLDSDSFLSVRCSVESNMYQWTFHAVFYVNICWFTLHFDICSAFKWSFNGFVREKVLSLSYSSAIFSPPHLLALWMDLYIHAWFCHVMYWSFGKFWFIELCISLKSYISIIQYKKNISFINLTTDHQKKIKYWEPVNLTVENTRFPKLSCLRKRWNLISENK